MSSHEFYMATALHCARQHKGWTYPNPCVGAVIVKNGKIIGIGAHEKYGEAHAEINALASCAESPQGATMYVTLEPCAHTGKQPPCSQALIKAGISHVVIGSHDPNPLVQGKGIRQLREAGIKVTKNIYTQECDSINTDFFHFITHKKPYVCAKWAMSIDGKIATHTGHSQWISNEISRESVAQMRHEYAGILVGVSTVISDDPLLTARRTWADGSTQESRQPARIILDTHLRTPLTSRLVQTAHDTPVYIATTCETEEKITQYTNKGVHILRFDTSHDHIPWDDLLIKLGKENITSLIIEGGASILGSSFEADIVDEARIYVAPKIIGGTDALSPVGGKGIDLMSQARTFSQSAITTFGDDICLTFTRKNTASPYYAQ